MTTFNDDLTLFLFFFFGVCFGLLQTMHDRLVSVFYFTTFDDAGAWSGAWRDILHCNAEIGTICNTRGEVMLFEEALGVGKAIKFSCNFFM